MRCPVPQWYPSWMRRLQSPARRQGRKQGTMSGAWKQWEGHVINSAFELKKYLGGSESSAVFLTEDHGQPPKPAAIKLVAADGAGADLQLSRWEMAREVQHPSLIRILQTGHCQIDDRELIFAVMEYGQENLAEIISHRPLTAPEAREMLTPILDALASLHSQGFVYGHLKPTNILAVNDQLKLASEGKDWELTESGSGIPGAYDPPETARGERSPAADVWSLGMVLAEVLTQHLPYWNQNGQPDPVLPENLPPPFLEIVRGCLRRDPKQRLLVAEIGALLYQNDGQSPQPRRVTNAQPASQKPPAAGAQTAFQKPARRTVFPLLIAAAAVLILLGGLSLLRDKPAKPTEIKTEQHLPKPDPRYPSAKNISPGTVSPRTKKTSAPPTPAPSVKAEAVSPPSASQPSARDVRPGGGPVDSAVVRQVLPDISQTARDSIRGTLRVNVRVKVDSSGNVAGAEFDSPPSSRYIAGMALQAAQSWKFAPNGPDAGRELIVHFEFTNAGTRAFVTRVVPQ